MALEHKGPTYYQDLFRPLHLACQSKLIDPTELALDCLSKLFTYRFWQVESNSNLVELIIDTICVSFIGPDTTDERIQTQVIKALTASICCDAVDGIHGGLLLKAVRVIYNIFLLSKSPPVQTIAQASLSQICQTIYNRIPTQVDFTQVMANYQDRLVPSPANQQSLARSDSLHSL